MDYWDDRYRTYLIDALEGIKRSYIARGLRGEETAYWVGRAIRLRYKCSYTKGSEYDTFTTVFSRNLDKDDKTVLKEALDLYHETHKDPAVDGLICWAQNL